MHIDAFDYTLPKDLIARHSVSPRDSARMLILHRETKLLEYNHVYDLAEYLRPGDLIILNNTKVFKARLYIEHKDKAIEIFYLRPDVKAKTEWHVLLGHGKKISHYKGNDHW